ncbi:MAG: PaaI family thioesterase [Acidimicrobiia bacterium]|nr:PaaI family thioesterase [Acidimicrobiia bacterium]
MTGPAAAPVTGSYPPAHHVLRDLHLESQSGPGLTATGRMPIPPQLVGPNGFVHPGALATLVDAVGGGLGAVAAQPDWIATADLTLHLVPARDVAAVTARGRVIRKGRTTIVMEVAVAGTDGPELGVATMTFAILPRRDGNPVIDATGFDAEATPRTTMALPTSGFTQPLEDSTGLSVVDGPEGKVLLPLTDYVRNSLGALQGGMVALTAIAAAERAMSAAAGRRLEVVDLQITYLALVKVGPAATTTTVLEVGDDRATAEVVVTDAGAGDRVTTRILARGAAVA